MFTLRSFIRVVFVVVVMGKLIGDSNSMSFTFLTWKHHKYHTFDCKSLSALMLNGEAIRGELCLRLISKVLSVIMFWLGICKVCNLALRWPSMYNILNNLIVPYMSTCCYSLYSEEICMLAQICLHS